MAAALLTMTVGVHTRIWQHRTPAVVAADSDCFYQVQHICGGTSGAGGLWSPGPQKACIQRFWSHLEPP